MSRSRRRAAEKFTIARCSRLYREDCMGNAFRCRDTISSLKSSTERVARPNHRAIGRSKILPSLPKLRSARASNFPREYDERRSTYVTTRAKKLPITESRRAQFRIQSFRRIGKLIILVKGDRVVVAAFADEICKRHARGNRVMPRITQRLRSKGNRSKGTSTSRNEVFLLFRSSFRAIFRV